MVGRKAKHTGPGRPPLGTKARQDRVTVRLSPEDRAAFEDAAAGVDETLSTFLVVAGRERAKRLKR